ncbi:hypothetical protein PFISCL1PPCAC_26552, partial [Pristionchus fissidentatus]
TTVSAGSVSQLPLSGLPLTSSLPPSHNSFQRRTERMVERRQINDMMTASSGQMPSTTKGTRTHYRSSRMEIIDYSDEELSFEPPLQMTRTRRHAICNDGTSKQELGKRCRTSNPDVEKLAEKMRSHVVLDASQYVQSVYAPRKTRTMSEDSGAFNSDTTDGERTRKNSEKDQSDIDSVPKYVPAKKSRTN